jgi:Na+/proline symporter
MTFSPLAFALYGLSGADLLMILAYFAAMLYIGFWSMKHVRDREGWVGIDGTPVGVAGCVGLLWLLMWIGS